MAFRSPNFLTLHHSETITVTGGPQMKYMLFKSYPWRFQVPWMVIFAS